jgi:formylglycine-generating enzyme required for sulfatase activity
MGSPEDQGYSDEHPQHRVDLSAFALGKFDVTFEEWDACVAAHGCSKNPSDQGWGRGRRPVIWVSWDDAQEYLRWLSRKSGHTYRLPSVAEWEYAARAGTTTTYYWGDDFGTGHCAGCGGPYDNKQTAPVGSFPPNPWGLYDMAGDVWQWTQDRYHDDYAGAPINGRAWEEGSSARVVRGGAWNAHGGNTRIFRAAHRFSLDSTYAGIGVRVARAP